jgi:hypothetical protein
MDAVVVSITLLGKPHAIVLPPSICEREELFVAWQAESVRGGHRSLRAAAALVGACTRVGRLAGATYAGHDYSVMSFGGAVYDWLRGQDAEGTKGLPAAAILIRDELVKSLTFLTEGQKRADFSEAPAARSTGP